MLYVCTRVGACAHEAVCGSFFHSSPSFYLETGFLTETMDFRNPPVHPGAPSSPHTVVTGGVAAQAFYVGSGDTNSGPDAAQVARYLSSISAALLLTLVTQS